MIASYSMGVNPAKCRLPSAAMVGPFDPAHDRDPEFLAGAPGLALSAASSGQAVTGEPVELTLTVDATKPRGHR